MFRQFGEPLGGYEEFSITAKGFLPNASEFQAQRSSFGNAFYTSTAELGLRVNQQLYVNAAHDGHTDARGKAAFNRRLSQLRAETVLRYLIAAGIESSRLGAKGFGPDKPMVPNVDAQEFFDRLHDLHAVAGQPSMRELQRRTRSRLRPNGINSTTNI